MLRRCFQKPNSDPCFGMIMPPTAAGGRSAGNDFGTMLEIKSVRMLSDGRSVVETRGTYRFRIMERGTLDGYMVARIERCSFHPFLWWCSASNLIFLSFGQIKKLYRILDYPSLYPDVSGDAVSILPPLPPIVSAGPDIQVTLSAASSATASSTASEPGEVQELVNVCRAFLVQVQRGAAPWVVQRFSDAYGPMPSDPAQFSYWMAMVSIFSLQIFGRATHVHCIAQSLIETTT